MNPLRGYVLLGLALAFAGCWAATQADLASLTPADLIAVTAVGRSAARHAEQPAVLVRNALPRAIPNDQETLVAFDVVAFEQGGELFSPAQPSRLVVPEDGLYVLAVQVGWRNEQGRGVLTSRLFLDAESGCSGGGAAQLAEATSVAGVDAHDYHHLTLIQQFHAGDHVELCVAQATGASTFVEGYGETWATLRWVGPDKHEGGDARGGIGRQRLQHESRRWLVITCGDQRRLDRTGHGVTRHVRQLARKLVDTIGREVERNRDRFVPRACCHRGCPRTGLRS